VSIPGTILGMQDVLEQGLTLLAGLDPELYATRAEEPFGASVGGHYRHVLDHFLCLAAGRASGTIDYDHRERSRELENNLIAAEQMTHSLIESFRKITERELAKNCDVVYSIGYSRERAERIPTTFARELAFCVSHAVHHFAIIKLICAHLSVPVHADLGVAPSTLQYRRAQAAN
jgi:hypothetical protein